MAGSGPAPAVENIGLQVNGVAPNRALYVQFNEAMDPSTINSNSILVKDSGGTAAAGTVTYNSDFAIASFQPNPPLQTNATYTLNVTTAAASSKGVHLQSDYSSTFTTRAQTDKSPIYVKNITPLPNATCVSASTPVAITFNEGADINTLNSSNIFITGPGGTSIAAAMSYNAGTATVTLTPNSPLPTGSISVTVQNVADSAGVAMTRSFTSSFSTACNGTGGGGMPGNIQFQASILDTKTFSTYKGDVTIDVMGNTTVELSGAIPSSTFTVQFCSATVEGNGKSPDCFNIETITTDASGKGAATAMFPQSGNWAGDFYLNDASGNAAYQTWLAPNVNNEFYLARLLPDHTVNHGDVTTVSNQEPLTSGTVAYSNGALTFTVQGASPLTNYTTIESETVYIGSSGSYQLNTFNTDAMGNGSTTTPLDGIGGDMLNVDPTTKYNSAGFMAGFSIP